MIKYLQRLKSKKGLTLVEVMIATVIFSLILLAVFSMFEPINKVADIVKSDSDMQRIVTATESFIAQQIRNSSEIEIWWGDPSLTTWAAIADRAKEFIEDKGSPDNHPQALVLKREGDLMYLYNIRLKEAPAIETALFTGLNDSSRWRVFNSSFYSGIELAIEAEIQPSNHLDQRRGRTFFMLQIDAYRDGDISLDSRSLSETQLMWIGGVNRRGSSNPPMFEARMNPDPPASGVMTGEFVIFYNNNVHLNRNNNNGLNDCPNCGQTPCNAEPGCP